MSQLLSTLPLSIENVNTLLGFEKTGQGRWPVWDRFLTIQGKRAYHIGNICETCAFFFERLNGANQSVSPSAISEELRDGIKKIDSAFVNKVMSIIPAGQYQAGLFRVAPQYVKPGNADDYFTSEQVDLWGIDDFWGLPHYPKTEYYRCQSVPMGEGDQLFEFIIPMFPHTLLRQKEVDTYSKRIEDNDMPTALALSVLDVKQPSDWAGSPSIKRHYCLAHYLIDGHHKTYAASQQNKPLTLLSFLAIDESIASEYDIQRVTALLENS